MTAYKLWDIRLAQYIKAESGEDFEGELFEEAVVLKRRLEEETRKNYVIDLVER